MISYRDSVKNKILKEHISAKHLRDNQCPNCGFIEQNPDYDTVCGKCGHLK